MGNRAGREGARRGWARYSMKPLPYVQLGRSVKIHWMAKDDWSSIAGAILRYRVQAMTSRKDDGWYGRKEVPASANPARVRVSPGRRCCFRPLGVDTEPGCDRWIAQGASADYRTLRKQRNRCTCGVRCLEQVIDHVPRRAVVAGAPALSAVLAGGACRWSRRDR